MVPAWAVPVSSGVLICVGETGWVMVGAGGAVVSMVKVIVAEAALVFPAASVWVALTV